jgi:hypothetical protein
VLSELATRELPEEAEPATRVGAELAARVRDRVAEVYGLGAAGDAPPEAPVASDAGAS